LTATGGKHDCQQRTMSHVDTQPVKGGRCWEKKRRAVKKKMWYPERAAYARDNSIHRPWARAQGPKMYKRERKEQAGRRKKSEKRNQQERARAICKTIGKHQPGGSVECHLSGRPGLKAGRSVGDKSIASRHRGRSIGGKRKGVDSGEKLKGRKPTI